VIKFLPYVFWYSERKRFNTGLPLYRLGLASMAIVASAETIPALTCRLFLRAISILPFT
jgi:hypothetical protein